MRVAIVYDRANKWGGAERLIVSLQKIFPSAVLFTSVYNPKTAGWVVRFKEVRTSFIQNFPLSNFHQLYAPLMPLAFESFNFDNFDLVFSVTSESAKGIITKPGTKHICICLTPTRYLWSGYKEYFKNPVLRFVSKPFVWYLRSWDKIAAQRPDKIIAISNEVKERIKKYYDRTSKVIYPPVGPAFSSLASKYQLRKLEASILGTRSYFLVVSRLVPYKKIDVVIRACNKLKLPLKIAGTGSQEWHLKLIADSNVQFLGKVSEEKLANLYQNCRALIFPGIEDFGLVMLEAQSFGKPVIAIRAGGAKEIIREGKTGEFFNEQTPISLAKVLSKWDDKRYNSNLCIENSERFSFEKFKKEFLNLL